MKHLFHLYRHELRMQFISPSSYIAVTIFLLLMLFVYAIILSDASSTMQSTLISEQFYKSFSIPVLFIVPLLTMKSIAEDRRLGTLQSLMTTPANSFEIVCSKFLGAYTFYLIIWLLTLSFPFVALSVFPSKDILVYLFDARNVIGSLIFIAVSGTFYVAIGIFCSSMTRSQLVAGMLSFLILFFVLMTSFFIVKLPIINFEALVLIEEPLDYIRAFKHLEDFSRGIIDTRPFFLYISSSLMLLGITTLVVEAKV